MHIDREVQKLILDTTYASFPDAVTERTFNKLVDIIGDGDKLVANILYLEGHGLVKSGISRDISDELFYKGGLIITSEGIDFLLDDGGVGAILKVVTVKIHADSLAQIEKFIMASTLSPSDKKKFSDRLRALPYETTRHLVTKLLDAGLNQVPNALQLIQTFLA